MSDLKKERNIGYDAVKTFSIFLVCIYHYPFFNANFTDTNTFDIYLNYFLLGAASAGVPLFFMVNGALLLNKPYEFRPFLHKIVKLISLFVIWDIILLVGFQLLTNHRASLKSFVLDLFYLKMDVTNHLWFLQALLSVYLFYPIIKEVYEAARKEVLYWLCFTIVLFSFGNLFLNSAINVTEFLFHRNYLKEEEVNFFPFINPFGNYYFSLFYFILGGLLSKKRLTYFYKAPSWVLIGIYLLSLFILFLYGIIMTISDQKLYDTVWYGYYSVMTLAMSISVFILFSRLEYRNKIINYCLIIIGSNTLGIYLVHRFIGWFVNQLVTGNNLSGNLAISLLCAAIIVVSSLLIVLAIKKAPILKKLVSI
ncbi:acyltransferase [Spirosoma sp.]|uniref:acyltransferase n=1 Tax=Spirosoma sp. TaxID=1899569 RepID=UPI00263891DC|nr:acyltransferase [Spirosoma sp.]MCX6216335.1 acyltransferase [Spirosoma sp.]